jgi:hypothetical protein
MNQLHASLRSDYASRTNIHPSSLLKKTHHLTSTSTSLTFSLETFTSRHHKISVELHSASISSFFFLHLCYNKMDLSWNMVREIPSVISHNWRERSFNWPMIVYLTLTHIVACVGLFTLPKCSKETLLWAFLLWPIT